MRQHWKFRTGRISIQVLNEYFVNVTQKLKPGLPAAEAWEDVESLMAWNPIALDNALLMKTRRDTHKVTAALVSVKALIIN